MKRFIFGTLLLTGLFVLSVCGKKTASPEELFLEYASLLTQGRYEEMYPYLTAQAQEHIDPETFAARYRNIYEGMGASDIRVNFREQGKEIYSMLCIAQQPDYIFGHVFSGLRSSQTVPAHGDPIVLFQICA